MQWDRLRPRLCCYEWDLKVPVDCSVSTKSARSLYSCSPQMISGSSLPGAHNLAAEHWVEYIEPDAQNESKPWQSHGNNRTHIIETRALTFQRTAINFYWQWDTARNPLPIFATQGHNYTLASEKWHSSARGNNGQNKDMEVVLFRFRGLNVIEQT